MWTSTITPVITQVNDRPASLAIPQYTAASQHNWLKDVCPTCVLVHGEDPPVHTREGTFTYYPNFDSQGLLLAEAATASATNASVPRHLKIDNTGYLYTGRFYGAGASVGLVDNFGTTALTLYNYTEVGYLSNVSCIVNETTQFQLYFRQQPYGGYEEFPLTYEALGPLPNSVDAIGFAAITLNYSNTILALAGETNADRYVYSFATDGDTYQFLNKTQCEVTFNPTMFSVAVNVDQRDISVSILPNEPENQLDPSGNLTQVIFKEVSSISQIDTTLYVSLLGNALQLNANNVMLREGSSGPDYEIALQAVEDSLESMLDNIFMAQIMVSNDTQTAHVTMTIPGVQIGSSVYLYITFAINSTIVCLFAVSAWATRFWHHNPMFEITDIKSSILAASAGGTKLSEAAPGWNGKPSDQIAGGMEVILRETALVLADRTNIGAMPLKKMKSNRGYVSLPDTSVEPINE